jgi:hypothetical protein
MGPSYVHRTYGGSWASTAVPIPPKETLCLLILDYLGTGQLVEVISLISF